MNPSWKITAEGKHEERNMDNNQAPRAAFFKMTNGEF